MNIKQHTIKKPVTIEGVGLHTGVNAKMTFLPAKPNHGIKFQRIDLDAMPIIEADVDNVVDLSRGTTLEKQGARVATVEHTMAALVGMQVDNILIQLDGPEIPIMDGSSKMFVDALISVGFEEQNALRNFFEVRETISYRDSAHDVEIAALPLDDYRVTVMIDYNSPVLGSQHANITDINQFAKEIASCRTFCFLHELEMLYKNNLIKGGDLNNAIVVVDRVVEDNELDYLAELFNKPKVEVKKEGILNNVELRYRNEPARHKLLDVMGDLALVGRPIKAQILAARPGHASNVAFARKLKKEMSDPKSINIPPYNPKLPPVMDINQIRETLPHRAPFLLVDKVFHLDETTVAGIKNVTYNEPFFQGHFPGNPVMPGVLIIEALAQTGGILALNALGDPKDYWTYLMKIEEGRFRKMVLPGDQLILKCELLEPIKRGIARMKTQAFIGNTIVTEAIMVASIVKKSK
jgi:UDP-3-O-[3-hydroxymyristoyl] N-acetylglucosamine deacetylase/3-hydroxyacyl-[acyl-carrier-protein] dehydratase